ncbi:MAG: DUF927 domain-containing protein [Candidatus Methanoperedens sp.]
MNEFDDDGNLIKTHRILLSSPFEIVEQLENLDTKETALKLKFNNKEISFSAGDLANKKGINMLASYGVITVESNSKLLCKYIMGYRTLNRIKESLIYDRFGWKDDGSFVLGTVKYTKDGIEKIELNVSSKQINAVHEKGTIDGWIKTTSGMMKHQNQRFKIYTAVVPTILNIIRESNYTLSDTGKTSIGKTTTSEVALSMYGFSEELIFSGKATEVGIERTLTAFCDMPVLIDEAHNIDQKQLDNIIYIIGNGVGKLRGAKLGGVQDLNTWRTVAQMTSENPIITESSNGGIGMRVIEISRKGGLGATDIEAVRTFEAGKQEHYGVFAPILVRWLISNHDKIKKIHKESLESTRAIIGKFAFNQELAGIAERSSNTYASILTAGIIFEDIYKELGGEQQDAKQIVLNKFETLLPEKELENITARGLNHIKSWIAANKSNFLVNGDRNTDQEGHPLKYKILGDITPEYYNIIPSELRYELDKAKFNMGALMNEFAESGYIRVGANGKKTRGVRIEGDVVQVYSFMRSVVDIASPDDEKKVK